MNSKIVYGVVGAVVLVALLFFLSSWRQTAGLQEALEAPNPTDKQIQIMADGLADQTGKYRGKADDRLRELGKRSIPALEKVSGYVGAEVRLKAAKLAAELDPDPEGNGFDGLRTLLQDPDHRVRRDGVRLAMRVLRAAFTSEDKLEYPHMGEILYPLAQDENASVREALTQALSYIFTDEAEKILKTLQKDEDRDVALHGKEQTESRSDNMKRRKKSKKK